MKSQNKNVFKIFFTVLLFLQFNTVFTQSSLNLSNLEWRLWGYRPNSWRLNFDFERFSGTFAIYSDIPISVPGSVQKALKDVGIIPDWNYELNSEKVEWVENRNWIISTKIPDKWILEHKGEEVQLYFSGIDGNGLVMVNGKEVGKFNNAFIPYTYNIISYLKKENNTLSVIFEDQPRYLGQINYTSRINEWKPRFNYGWDWIARMVQIGIWDNVYLSTTAQKPYIENIQIATDATKQKDNGILRLKAKVINNTSGQTKIKVMLTDTKNRTVFENFVDAKELLSEKSWTKLKIQRWYPNGLGEQPLYNLEITLLDANKKVLQKIDRKIGFRHIEWLPCEGAASGADPWICNVNDRSIFLQGINWTPILPNFADLQKEDYEKRLKTYKELGINVIRVWGGGFAEKNWLYDLCDQMGILIWQEFPLSSSGIDNYPPDGQKEINEMSEIVQHYITRLQHHPSIFIWCGGNELRGNDDKPVTVNHRMIAMMKQLTNSIDPLRRFVASSPSGPNFDANYNNFGSGDNWDIHGPWTLPFKEKDNTMNAVKDYWQKNDALFISEAGVPGAMSADMIRKYSGAYNPLPGNDENPVWKVVNWWVEWNDYLRENTGKENDLENYVEWSQKRQTQGLSIALGETKKRFPKCGGFIIWMGHDSYPCMVNTSIMDFEGNLKPAAIELSKIWKNNIKNK